MEEESTNGVVKSSIVKSVKAECDQKGFETKIGMVFLPSRSDAMTDWELLSSLTRPLSAFMFLIESDKMPLLSFQCWNKKWWMGEDKDEITMMTLWARRLAEQLSDLNRHL